MKYKLKPEYQKVLTKIELIEEFVEMNERWWTDINNILYCKKDVARAFCLIFLDFNNCPDYDDSVLITIEKYFKEHLKLYDEIEEK